MKSELTVTLDATHIQPNLFMGGRPPTGTLVRKEGFDVLVLCAAELQMPAVHFPGVEIFHIPLEDDSSKPVELSEWEAIVRTAERVVRRLRSGKRVLVTCAAGLNRSGVVTAAALHFLTGKGGHHTAAYVARRRVVGGQSALYNKAFVSALTHRLPARAKP